MPSLPTGTVTFLFTDIEGSTRLLQQLKDAYADVLGECRRLVRAAVQKRGGQEVDTEGDAVFAVFSSAREALLAAVTAQQCIVSHPWPEGAAVRVRMGLRTGEARVAEGGYVGMDVHRAARICAAGHGGQILVSDAVSALVAKDLPDGVSLRDLGEHRLEDLAHPHRLLQAVAPGLPIDFPSLRSLDTRPHNLPIQLTSFVGREREITEVARLLPTARLMTLTGFAGVGKTRLALRVAADLVTQYPHGVWMAELGVLSDPTLVPKAVAMALEVPEQPGRALAETLKTYLRAKTILLILDNCEHLVLACADLAGALLRWCPDLRILATSREPLGLSGEVIWRVPAMSVPTSTSALSVAEVTKYDAVRLFVDRAALSHPGFRVTTANVVAVTQVAHRLEGIPLAIELAASRVKALPVEIIAAKLDDRFRLLTQGGRTGLPHQQTLRATLDWSYDLLSEQERILLQRLSVFAGGFTLEAAEQICPGQGLDDSNILDLLSRLVEKSLVVFDERDGQSRYRLLESVRQYGRARLQESGEADDVRRRHRDWYLALAEQVDGEIWGPRQELWLSRLETEHDNLRAALEWSSAEKDGAEAALRLAGALHQFWYVGGHWNEGRRWLEEALARSNDAPPSALPKALRGATQLAWRQGDYGRAVSLGEKGLAICRKLADKEGSAFSLLHLGVVAMRQADYERAGALFEESLNLFHELGDKSRISWVLDALGALARRQKDYERATALFTKSLALFRELGEKWGIATALRDLGSVALRESDYQRAAAFFIESLTLCKEVRVRWLTELCLEGLARVASAKEHHEQAARLFGAAEVLRETLGLHRSPFGRAAHGQHVASTRAALGDIAFAAAWAEGRAMALEQAIEYALEVEAE